MGNPLDTIPGYREAIVAERDRRDSAFLDLPQFICGVEVLPFTLDRLLFLKAAGDPFVTGAVPSPIDACLFLWSVSREYRAALRGRGLLETINHSLGRWWFNRCRKRFVRSVSKLGVSDAIHGIRNYLDDVFLDSPGGSRGDSFSPSYYSGVATVVYRMANEFHWRETDLMNMPLARMYQYLRMLNHKSDPKAILFNPSDKVRGRWMEQLNNERRN